MTADDYLREVELALRDLPWRQRRKLVVELRGHLAELPPDTNLYARLGAPDRYAAELRAAAGLERRRGPIAFLRARRPLYLVLTALVLTVIGLAIGTLAWITSYQPIVQGMSGQYPPNAKLAVGQDLYEVPFRQGRHFVAGMSLVNDGHFTVHVTGVVPDAPIQPLKPSALYLAGPGPDNGGFPVPHRRFHPFDLAPGQVAYVVLRGTFKARCHTVAFGGQSFWELRAFDVRFNFLWRSGTAKIAFPTPLQIDSPNGQICDIRP